MRLRLGLRDWGVAELAAGVLGALGLVSRGRAEGRLAAWFEQAFSRPAFVVNAGTTALRIALECLAAQRPDRREVIVPALACPAVTRAVRACGLQPVYADIGDDLNTPVDRVRACLGPATLALVVVHAYGHAAADTAALEALCREAGVDLVDDAAQRVDPASGLGTAGAFGVFSFAQSKSVVSGIDGSGGVLLVNDGRHRAAVARRVSDLPPARGRTLAWLEFLTMARAPRLAYYLGRWRQRRRPASSGPARIGAIDAAIALRQVASLPVRRQRRVRALQWYRAALLPAGIVAPQLRAEKAQDAYLARLMVRLVPSERDACREALRRAGIATRLPYPLPVGIEIAGCPNAARDAAALLELPLPAELTAADAWAVARVLSPFGFSSSATTRVLACSTSGN